MRNLFHELLVRYHAWRKENITVQETVQFLDEEYRRINLDLAQKDPFAWAASRNLFGGGW